MNPRVIWLANSDGLFTLVYMKKVQSAAIPYLLDEADQLSVLLVTSRRKGRWVLRKGTVSGMLPQASAAREAFEEAGVIGLISETPFATYHLRKKVGCGAAIAVPNLPLSGTFGNGGIAPVLGTDEVVGRQRGF